MSFKPESARFISTLVSNIEEGLVLTVGLLCGVAIAGLSQDTIVLIGTIFILIGGVSAGSRYMLNAAYSSEQVVGSAARVSILIGLLYVLAGIVPLLPYMIIDVSRAFTTSIICAFSAAFIIGLWSGHQGAKVWKSAWHMAYVAAAGSIIGAIVHAVL